MLHFFSNTILTSESILNPERSLNVLWWGLYTLVLHYICICIMKNLPMRVRFILEHTAPVM